MTLIKVGSVGSSSNTASTKSTKTQQTTKKSASIKKPGAKMTKRSGGCAKCGR